MSKMTFLTWSVVALVLLNAGGLVYFFSQRQKNDQPVNPEGASTFIIQHLKLDETQQEEFFELRRQHQDATRRIREEDRKLHDHYFDLLKTDNPDQSAADSIAKEIGNRRSMMEAATFTHFHELRKICRADQKKLFDETIDEIMRMMAPKSPPHRPPPRP